MEINNKCYRCNEYFSKSYKKIGVFTKCSHLNHLACETSICLICNKNCGPMYHGMNANIKIQDYINVLSTTKVKNNFKLIDKLRGFFRIIKSIPYIFGIFFRLYFNLITLDYMFSLIDYLISIFNIKINCSKESREKLLDTKYKRILIANHTNFHDTLIIGSLLNKNNITGFIASTEIKSNLFGKVLLNIIPHVILEKENNNGFNRISEYFTKYSNESKLLIFPEGMLTHSQTLAKFRTTAFKLGYPVQPIILSYKENIFDLVDFDMWFYPEINVNVTILDPIETDGSNESIEKIRKLMASEGKFYLSNVINKNLVI